MPTTPVRLVRSRVRTARLSPGMVVTAVMSPYAIEDHAMRPTTRYGTTVERRTVSRVSVPAHTALRTVEFTDGTRSVLVPGHQAWTVEALPESLPEPRP